MTIHDQLVYGERASELAPAILMLIEAGSVQGDQFCFPSKVSLPAVVGRPFLRALRRAEAELLLEEAEALRWGPQPLRTDEERRSEALIRIGAGIRPAPPSRN